MKLSHSINIDKSAKEVWQVLAEHFDKAQLWMTTVLASHKKDHGHLAPNAPMIGRICAFTDRANGPIVDETIKVFDCQSLILGITAVPRNTNTPVEQNHSTYTVKDLPNDLTQVTLEANIELKDGTELTYSALKSSISISLSEQLQELKHYVETGQAHPRNSKNGYENCPETHCIAPFF